MTPGYGDPIRWWSVFSPNRIALVDRTTGTRVSYRELDVAAARWTGLLRNDIGVKRGDRVAILMGNRREAIEIFLACVRLGALLIPLNWRLSPRELGAIVSDARPSIVIGDEKFRSSAEEAERNAGLELRWVDVDREGPRSKYVDSTDQSAVDGEDPAMVIYTSGSTGKPKGAVLPHRQLLYNAIATTTAWELGSEDVGPISTPFFHTGGWHVFAAPLWLRGGRVVLLNQFDPETFLDTLAEEGCTVALAVPTQLAMLTQSSSWGRAIPSLRWLISGGAPCPAALGARVCSAGYRFREGYGLTECGPNCFAMSSEEAMERPGSVGRPVPFLQMRLVDEALTDVPNGEPGELLLRGPQVFTGYLDAPEKTAEVFTAAGWLRTGDLARRDDAGAYYICGRRKEMFISGGENVFPGEVEAALTDCPGIAEVVVVGVEDPLWGEVGRAFVVARQGVDISEDAVLSHARERLGRYKVPKSVVLLDEIPRLGSGKPDRRALMTMAGR